MHYHNHHNSSKPSKADESNDKGDIDFAKSFLAKIKVCRSISFIRVKYSHIRPSLMKKKKIMMDFLEFWKM